MKVFFSFVVGFFVGIVASVLMLLFVENETFLKNIIEDGIITHSYMQGRDSSPDYRDGLTLFRGGDKKINIDKHFVVFQSLDRNAALVKSGRYPDVIYALFIGDRYSYYNDRQVIEVPRDRRVKEVGTYKYVNVKGIARVIPAIEFK